MKKEKLKELWSLVESVYNNPNINFAINLNFGIYFERHKLEDKYSVIFLDNFSFIISKLHFNADNPYFFKPFNKEKSIDDAIDLVTNFITYNLKVK